MSDASVLGVLLGVPLFLGALWLLSWLRPSTPRTICDSTWEALAMDWGTYYRCLRCGSEEWLR